jgi:hypothetical protein
MTAGFPFSVGDIIKPKQADCGNDHSCIGLWQRPLLYWTDLDSETIGIDIMRKSIVLSIVEILTTPDDANALYYEITMQLLSFQDEPKISFHSIGYRSDWESNWRHVYRVGS